MPAIDDLTLLGLSSKEAFLYLNLLEVGKTTVYALSKRSAMPRTTVYFLLESLVSKGLVATQKRIGTRVYSAHNPSYLVSMVEREKQSIGTKLDMAQALSKTLLTLFQTKIAAAPRIEVYEGTKDIENFLYQTEERWHHSLRETDKTWWGFEDESIYAAYKSWFQHIWRKFERERREDLCVKIFSSLPPPKELKAFSQTEIKPLPSHYTFLSSLWLFGNYLVTLETQQKPHSCIHIHDARLTQNLRTIFSMLWGRS